MLGQPGWGKQFRQIVRNNVHHTRNLAVLAGPAGVQVLRRPLRDFVWHWARKLHRNERITPLEPTERRKFSFKLDKITRSRTRPFRLQSLTLLRPKSVAVPIAQSSHDYYFPWLVVRNSNV